MKKTYCDICGKEIESDKALNMSIQRLEGFYHGSIFSAEKYSTYKVADKFEICEYCRSRMLECIKGMTAPWVREKRKKEGK